MLQKISVYGSLSKAEEADDGTLKIAGVASSEVVDSAGEIVLASAMRAAIPGFMNSGRGSLRVMHRSDVAAGTVDSVEVDNESGETRITGTIIDEKTIRAVKLRALRGLSIGGKVLSRDKKDPKRITAVAWSELSLVDRPACGAAVLFARAQPAEPLHSSLTPGGTDDMAPVKDLGALTEEQVRDYMSTLSVEDLNLLLTRVIFRNKLGRRY